MRKSRFSEEQIIGILKVSEAGVETGELCRRHGITQAGLYRWKRKFGGIEVNEARSSGGAPAESRAQVRRTTLGDAGIRGLGRVSPLVAAGEGG